MAYFGKKEIYVVASEPNPAAHYALQAIHQMDVPHPAYPGPREEEG